MLSIFPTNLDFLSFEVENDRDGTWKPRVMICCSVQMQQNEQRELWGLSTHRNLFSLSVILF